MLEDRLVLRMNEQDIEEALTTPIPPPAPAPTPPSGTDGFPERLAQFYATEGVVALLERGSDSDLVSGGSNLSWQAQRVDGGTIFPTSGGSRDPKAPQQVPSATIAVEHYNRLLRVLEKNIPVRIELNIQTTFYPETAATPNGINTIAEIPGTDLADEVVILGAHLDTTAAATGATDNATGSAAMMEALRVIKSLGLQPRRTIRVALWGGEEHGLLGSRAYVAAHYGGATAPKPLHGKVSAYYNLDNGTGRWSSSRSGSCRSRTSGCNTSARDRSARPTTPRSTTPAFPGSSSCRSDWSTARARTTRTWISSTGCSARISCSRRRWQPSSRGTRRTGRS
jgi:hypothetical protein